VETRPATFDDMAAIADLQRRWEIRMLGGPEESEAETREALDRVENLDSDTLLIRDDTALLGIGLRWRNDTWLLVDPDAQPSIYADLLAWFAAGTPSQVGVLSTDDNGRAAVVAAGWQHRKSAFDLLRKVDGSLELAEPVWPDGITVRGFAPEDAAAVHHLIYIDAGWAEIPGHPHRDYEEWRSIFVTEHTIPDQQVLAWRGERLVGIAMGRTWDDGTGWISQLATAKDERGRGLGRAMLLDALARRRAGGATALGLSVQTENRAALRMYVAAGLEIDREWMEYAPPS
jgi:ribosomal protein S18 acetylase RimI-like enzyme